ncbi:hypothetical protein N8I77_001615 [Diaporthe amygdali]|uniref:laccase n=1 Tax=Phomopsis amygdali TaxID=1214568 RepID=A0AAD9SR97_PHOAM|nr:hypothetical protein N8I77_001615 [Diaporthe amygdali]
MHLFTSLFFTGLLSLQPARAAPSSLLQAIEVRQDASCNTPSDRACWTDGFDINTDFETKTPLTGVVRPYTLTLTEETNWKGPDGVTKDIVMLVNGDIIGPTIYAHWGDTISVKVINNLESNGTSIHWHGVRQVGSNLHDGVNGITECPIPPKGGERVYTFIARQYGSAWYHSHFSAQYGNGIIGPIQIDGPASLPYDVDLGPMLLTDYYHESADNLVLYTETNGPPPSDNVLFNGHAVNPSTGDGEYGKLTLTPGKRHRLRLINTSVDNHFQVSIVNHDMTVIASDFVPVNAFTTDSLFIGVGQRYDVTIEANQDIGNYWLNVTFGGGNLCGMSNNPYPAAILHYDGAPDGLPTKKGTRPRDHNCLDLLDLTPVVERKISTEFTPSADNTMEIQLPAGPKFVWKINNKSIRTVWQNPVAQYVAANRTDYPETNSIWSVNAVDQWVYWLIENDPEGAFSLPHPIHLHGHDFLVVGRSPEAAPATQTKFAFDASRLNGNNPVRRDVAMLPAAGWLLLAFKTDNPGAWLMHCHIAWHVSGGLGMTFLERVSDYRAGLKQSDVDVLNEQCKAWNDYFPHNAPWPQVDSGL